MPCQITTQSSMRKRRPADYSSQSRTIRPERSPRTLESHCCSSADRTVAPCRVTDDAPLGDDARGQQGRRTGPRGCPCWFSDPAQGLWTRSCQRPGPGGFTRTVTVAAAPRRLSESPAAVPAQAQRAGKPKPEGAHGLPARSRVSLRAAIAAVPQWPQPQPLAVQFPVALCAAAGTCQ